MYIKQDSLQVQSELRPYRHCLQDLLDDVRSISLTVVASLHNPETTKHGMLFEQ